VHRLDQISAEKPAKLRNSKSLTLDFSRRQIWPVFYATIGRGPSLTNYKPLSAKQKFEIARAGSFNRGTVFLAAVFAVDAEQLKEFWPDMNRPPRKQSGMSAREPCSWRDNPVKAQGTRLGGVDGEVMGTGGWRKLVGER
jgi:hypothetical protein